MSFSQEIKNELCSAAPAADKPCCALAESYGVLLLANNFSKREIRIVTESEAFARRMPRLFALAFGKPFPEPSLSGGGRKFVFAVSDKALLRRMFDKLGYDYDRHIVLHLNGWLAEEDCCRAALLRGMFLAGGFAVDPAKKYHLELVTPHAALSREIYALLGDIGFSPKLTPREHNHVIYFKESEAIEDFLVFAGAPRSAMALMEAKVVKDVRNNINRKVNCETANILRVVDAGQTQLDAIRALRRAGLFDSLPEQLKSAAALREENPDAPLSELCRLSDPPVSKSGLNHRLGKLLSLASRL